MKINRKNPNPGTFFPWPGEPKGSTRGIVLRIMNGAALSKLDAETITVQNVFNDGQLYKDSIPDEEKRKRLRLDYCIVKWNGLIDEDGAEIPCTIDTKVEIMENHPEISEFVGRKLMELNKLITAKRETERKNS